jgi:hypothetical protein
MAADISTAHSSSFAKAARAISSSTSIQLFREPEALMRNIELVTAHLRTKVSDPRGVLQLVPTHEGLSYAWTAARTGACMTGRGQRLLSAADRALFLRERGCVWRFQTNCGFSRDATGRDHSAFHDTPAAIRGVLNRAVENNAANRREQ